MLRIFVSAICFYVIWAVFSLDAAQAQDNPNILTLKCQETYTGNQENPQSTGATDTFTYTINFQQGAMSISDPSGYSADGNYIDGQSIQVTTYDTLVPTLTITATTIELNVVDQSSSNNDIYGTDVKIDRVSGHVTAQDFDGSFSGKCKKITQKTQF